MSRWSLKRAELSGRPVCVRVKADRATVALSVSELVGTVRTFVARQRALPSHVRSGLWGWALAVVAMGWFACGDSDGPVTTAQRGLATGPGQEPVAAPKESSGPRATSTGTGADDKGQDRKLAPVPVTLTDEATFAEAQQGRDPFRPYFEIFDNSKARTARRSVIMGNVAVEEMRLTAILRRGTRASAMLVGSDGVGYVVHRGDYLGRAEYVSGSGDQAFSANWRVERIDPGQLVLRREDPRLSGREGGIPVRRVLTLFEEG